MPTKNKKAEQIEARQKHLEQLKQSRRQEQLLDRQEPSIEEKPTILIVCEGENTEPSYFRQFRLSSAIVKPVGEGYNTVSLVNRAQKLSENKNYDQVWCVFDKDDFSPNDFNSAITLAKNYGFKVAYSNQAFEYWIILHFEDHQGGGMHRNDYDAKTNALLKSHNAEYDGKHSKCITPEIFQILDGVDEQTGIERKRLAIKRAKKIHQHAKDNGINPDSAESSTTVFKLVEEILKYV